LEDKLKEPGTYRFTIKAIGEGVEDALVIDVVWSGVWNQITAYEVLDNA